MTQVYQLPNYIKAIQGAKLSPTMRNVCMGATLYDIRGKEGREVVFRSDELPNVEYTEFRFTRKAVGVIRFDGYDIKE